MPDETPILSLPLILASQAQKHVTHNEALKRLDILTQLAVRDRTRTAPPAAPEEGDCHIVATGATGLWAGHDGDIAAWWGGVWTFLTPRDGWSAWVLDENLRVARLAGQWSAGDEVLNASQLGIGTTADATNRLAVSSPATLLTHAGQGHQLKLNKAAAGQTVSLLYQSNWSGRAEMGLAGSDDFSIKVSANGTGWTTALQIAAASGLITGSAVTSGAADTTAGRLLRVGAGHQQLDASLYRRGNVLGTVAQTAGVPTGAVAERGSNANGEYLRLADGTQFCFKRLTLTGQDLTIASGTMYRSGNLMAGAATYPATFAAAPAVSISAHVDDASIFTIIGGTGDGANSPASAYAVYHSSLTARTIRVNLVAVGRWF